MVHTHSHRSAVPWRIHVQDSFLRHLTTQFRRMGWMQDHASYPHLGCSLRHLQDSFLRRLTTQFFQMLHEERAHVSPGLAEQVGALAGAATRRNGCGGAVWGLGSCGGLQAACGRKWGARGV